MIMRSTASSAVLVVLLASACVLAPPSDPVLELRAEAMSKQVFESILPELETLEPGDDIGSFLDERKEFYTIGSGGEVVDPILIIPGWIGTMSGGINGFPLGLHFAHSEKEVRGRHVFGYVWGGMNLSPQFLIITEATKIEKAEYDKLSDQKAERIGTYPGDSDWRYFRDLRVVETRTVPSVGHADVEASVAAGEIQLGPAVEVAEFYSEGAFREVEKKLRELPVGTDLWGMVSELGGFFITNDYGGRNFAIAVKGFRGQETRSIDTDEASYALRPFGYGESGRWTVKLIAIFKNGQLERVVPHTGLEDWSGYLVAE